MSYYVLILRYTSGLQATVCPKPHSAMIFDRCYYNCDTLKKHISSFDQNVAAEAVKSLCYAIGPISWRLCPFKINTYANIYIQIDI